MSQAERKKREETEKQEKRERYRTWQDYRIKQLSFSINLFLTFAIAGIFWEKPIAGIARGDLIWTTFFLLSQCVLWYLCYAYAIAGF